MESSPFLTFCGGISSGPGFISGTIWGSRSFAGPDHDHLQACTGLCFVPNLRFSTKYSAQICRAKCRTAILMYLCDESSDKEVFERCFFGNFPRMFPTNHCLNFEKYNEKDGLPYARKEILVIGQSYPDSIGRKFRANGTT